MLAAAAAMLVAGFAPGDAAGAPSAAPAEGSGAAATVTDTVRGAAYYRVALRRPGEQRGRAFGFAAAVFPDGPWPVGVTRSGVYVYELEITAPALPRARPGFVHVAWIASPDLSHVRRVGVLERDSTLRATVDFDNKFLVFVTEEASAEASRPEGRVVLRGVSRSGRMVSMFSHGFCPPDTPC